jgi:hypothetical protein
MSSLDHVSHIASTSRRAFLRTWGNPETTNRARPLDVRTYRYQRLYELYDGTAFNIADHWTQYKAAFNLYRYIRQIWDHVHELVEFYAMHIWSGSLASDGKHLPDGIANAVPLAEDVDDDLAAAIAQLWSWWNFQENMILIPRYVAMLGELLVELHDDPERGKIEIELIWPGYVSDIRLDKVGNVIYYCIEYSYFDRDDGQYHTYKREVDKRSFRTFRDGDPYNFDASPVPDGTDPDGEPYGLGYGAYSTPYVTEDDEDGYEVENPYGFVPAVWFRHYKTIGVRGEPALWSTQAALDELNGLLSHMMDKTHVNLEAPILISGNIAVNRLQKAFTNMYGAVKRTFTADADDDGDEDLNVLQGPQGTTFATLEIDISKADVALQRIERTIERKCPEVTFYSQLRQMTQLTGPSANSLLGDVSRKVRIVASGHDRELVKLQQMGVSIGGMRYQEGLGGWAEPTEAQEKFSGYDLESFEKGELNHDIMPRDLVPPTAKDKLDVLAMKKNVMPWLPADQIAHEAGYNREDALKWEAEWEKKQEEKAQQAMEQQQQQIQLRKPVGAPPGGPQRGAPTQNKRSSNGNGTGITNSRP